MYKILFSILFLNFTPCLIAQTVTFLESSNEWKYREGSSSIQTDWNTLGYDDSSWNTGNGGVGYGDNDDGTILSDVQSVYMRQEFTIHNLNEITQMSLFGSFDDGFTAYLNGVEIVRSNLEGEPPLYNTSAIEYKEAELTEGNRPSEFFISNTTLNSLLIEGSNLLAVQTHNFGETSSDLSSNYWLIGNHTGDDNLYLPLPDWYELGGFDSNLPILKITSEGTIEDEPKINGRISVIHNPDNLPNNSLNSQFDHDGNITIEKRGQSSLYLFPKNGYGFETKDSLWNDMDIELLGLPEEEDWILHGPYTDKTFMRNIVAMQIANDMGQYASRTQPVELIVNGQYHGIYILMEKIKRDKNRVDIAKLTETDIEGVELTGGYVFKIDKGERDWSSTYNVYGNNAKLGFQYVSPKRTKIHPKQEEYIQSYVDSFEIALKSPAFNYGGKFIDQYIDLESFADHYIISELTRNIDAFRISTYLHKEKDTDGGLLKMGPVWDYNLGFGNVDYCSGWETNGLVIYNDCSGDNPFWWYRLLEFGPFNDLVKCRYQNYRETILSNSTLTTLIDQQEDAIDIRARERDDEQWGVIGQYIWPNYFVGNTYISEINYLKTFISNRLDFLDSVWGDNCITTPVSEIELLTQISPTPNPASNYFTLELDDFANDYTLILTDLVGRHAYQQKIVNRYETINISALADGVYIGSLIDQNGQRKSQFKLIVEK